MRDNLEEDPEFAIPREKLARYFPLALRSAQPEIRRLATGIEQSADRRLARDAERIDAYYRDMLRQIEKRMLRRTADAQAAEKERTRAAATQLDRAAKLDDLARKYSLRIRVEPGDVLVAPLPVLEISARLIRKKAERVAMLHWNPALGALESPWCESCFGRAHPLFLCDERVHFLCKSCQTACPNCGQAVLPRVSAQVPVRHRPSPRKIGEHRVICQDRPGRVMPCPSLPLLSFSPRFSSKAAMPPVNAADPQPRRRRWSP